MDELKINAEIKALYNTLFNSHLNLMTKERTYLYNKLLDLNHSYLLIIKNVLSQEQYNRTLKKEDYKIKNVADIIPAYYYDYINNKGIFNSPLNDY